MPNTTNTINRPETYQNKAERAAAEAQALLKEAIENLSYWKRRAAIAVNPIDKANCQGLVSGWRTTRDARRKAVVTH